MGSGVDAHHGANPAVEHPIRNLKPALRYRTADTTAEYVRACSLNDLMNVNLEPRTPAAWTVATGGMAARWFPADAVTEFGRIPSSGLA